MTDVLDPAALPAYQVERRRRIILAARSLFDEKAFELIQVKDVAERAGVAVATIYRYFSSKDHLYTVLLREWGQPTKDAWYEALPPADRFRARLHQRFNALGRAPNFMKIIMVTNTTQDAAAIAELSAFGEELAEPVLRDLAALGPDVAAHIEQMTRSLMTGMIGQMMQGWLDLPTVLRIVDTFADLVKDKLESVTN